jgi:UDP-N-acetylmuramoyl-L-alanyl-D-glutamate--2,6-diaminopimelate ligase
VLTGIPSDRPVKVIADRATAIATAIQRAQPGDGVLIAGKGHEDYQIIGTEKIHFDDREQARAALAQRS